MVQFEQAETEYLKMVGLIKELCTIRSGKLDQEEYTIVLTRFDTSIQAILLYVALLNGFLHENERLFITQITIYGNLMEKLNITGKMRLFRLWQPLTWDNINETTIEHERLIDIIKETTVSELLSYVTVLATIDKDISSKCYIDELSGHVPSLIRAVCIAEDESIDKEQMSIAVEQGIEFYNNTFRGIWEDYRSSFFER